jgi:predicted esterase
VLVFAAAVAAVAATTGAYVRNAGPPRTPTASPMAEIPTAAPTAPPPSPIPVKAPAPFRFSMVLPDKATYPYRANGPCEGCRVSVPGVSDPRPLLVLLHGDNETAASMFDAWAPAAEARAIAVLALACPLSEGCTDKSWWRWNGDPSYLLGEIHQLRSLQRIDPERMWIVGWSGGASYIGYRTQEIERSFAAIVLHGGGIRPADPSCSTPKASVYFLVGDANPLHNLAVQLRDHYASCEHDLTWNLLKGADHDGERRALASRRVAILDWLVGKRRPAAPDPSAQPADN